jgi:hypothetical protein
MIKREQGSFTIRGASAQECDRIAARVRCAGITVRGVDTWDRIGVGGGDEELGGRAEVAPAVIKLTEGGNYRDRIMLLSVLEFSICRLQQASIGGRLLLPVSINLKPNCVTISFLH